MPAIQKLKRYKYAHIGTSTGWVTRSPVLARMARYWAYQEMDARVCRVFKWTERRKLAESLGRDLGAERHVFDRIVSWIVRLLHDWRNGPHRLVRRFSLSSFERSLLIAFHRPDGAIMVTFSTANYGGKESLRQWIADNVNGNTRTLLPLGTTRRQSAARAHSCKYVTIYLDSRGRCAMIHISKVKRPTGARR